MIALVTDSNAQLTPALEARFGAIVVPLTVVVDGRSYLERVELSAHRFFGLLRAGAVVSTAAPSPGAFVDAYTQAARRGANAIVSIHVGSGLSATINAASLATRESPVPVEIVDTNSASFAIALSVWAAADAATRTDDVARIADAARAVAGRIGNVFVAGALDLAQRGGRLDANVDDRVGVPLLSLDQNGIRQIGVALDVVEAADGIAKHVLDRAAGAAVRVGVGDAAAPRLAAAIGDRLEGRPEVVDLVRYEAGPSVAAHTGLGTAGVVFHTLDPTV